MRYLIDTNIFVFLSSGGLDLSKHILNILNNYNNQIYISSESIREIIHLIQTNRIKPNIKKGENLFVYIEDELGIGIKYIGKEHLSTFTKLPVVPPHNDPADRLIIAHAITEKLALISSDKKFSLYTKYGLNFIENTK
jgi:PIN domain nuclease of toxin-antitoxin system